MLNYLLFFIYLALFCWLLTKIKFSRDAGIAQRTIIILFIIRIAAGVINGYINLYHYSGTDASAFHHEGIIEYHLLFNDPKEYFTNLFQYNSYLNTGLLDITDSFWNNLRTNIVIKLLSVFDIFSNCNFFINIIFYNFIVFFGSLYFYKIYIKIFPDKQKWLLVGLFLLPSLLYFTSGIQKDGLIFLALGIACYNLFYLLRDGFYLKRILGFAIGLVIIFLLRNFVLITLIPAFIAWAIAEKNKKWLLQTFIIVYVFFIAAFFNLGFLRPSLDLPQYVSSRQIAFIQIAKGSQSAININPLFSNFRSFLNNAPQAFNHTLMRPYLTEKFTFLYIPAALEILVYEVLFLVYLFFRVKNESTKPFIYFGIFFSLSMFLMIGYTIPILGAIVRYRSIYFPLLIIPLLCSVDGEKFRNFFHINKKNNI